MKKIKIVILIIAFIFGSLSISYASTVSPLNNAVSDVKVTFSTSGDGDSNSTVVVSPMKEGSIDYLEVTSVKCYKDGILVDNIGPIQSSPAMF